MKGTIIYIGGFRLPDGNAAGPRVMNNAKIFRELGYKVVFIDVADKVDFNVEKNFRIIEGFECYSKKYPDGKRWIEYLTSISDFKKIYMKYNDVKMVVTYNYQSFAFFKLKRFCAKKKIKLISDCTEWYQRTINIIKLIDTEIRMQHIQKRIDGVISISGFLHEYYKNYNSVQIPPLVDINDDVWKKTADNHEGIVFSYVGSPGKNKDKLDVIIDALSRIKTDRKYLFNIIGITREQYLEYYPQDKEKLEKLTDNVKFLGRVQRDYALKCLKESDFSVFFRPDTLTTKAGFPTKYAEAVTCGIPVVANHTSDLCEYLKDGVNGFAINGFDMKDVKETFERIFETKDEQIGTIKKYCEENNGIFDYRNYVDEMKKILK